MGRDAQAHSLTDGSNTKAKGFAAPCFEGRCRIVPARDQLAAQGEHWRVGAEGKFGRRAGVVAD
jgi:hypothetical protein